MTRIYRASLLTLFLLVGTASSSRATTIGFFSYDPQSDPLNPVFTVDNNSDNIVTGGFDFTNIVVKLFSGLGGLTPTYGVAFDPLGVGGSAYTTDALPTGTFDRARLTFDYEIERIAYSSETFLDINDSIALIDAELPPTPVPEPATLILTTVGAAIGLARRRIRS